MIFLLHTKVDYENHIHGHLFIIYFHGMHIILYIHPSATNKTKVFQYVIHSIQLKQSKSLVF